MAELLEREKRGISMAMLHVECSNCLSSYELRGWIEPEDLKGTKWDGYTQEQIKEAETKDPNFFYGLDPWDKFENNNERCLICGKTDGITKI